MKNVESAREEYVIKNPIGGNEIPTLVTEAELILIKDKRPTCEGLIRCIKEWKSFIAPEIDFNSVGDLSIGVNTSKGVFEYWEPVKPILISRTEPISYGEDWAYDLGSKELYKTYKGIEFKESVKVLCLPEEFTKKQLENIVDWELKEGSKVFVKCERIWVFSAYASEEDYKNKKSFYEKEFVDHTTMKVFSAKHSAENKKEYPEYVSDYTDYYKVQNEPLDYVEFFLF